MRKTVFILGVSCMLSFLAGCLKGGEACINKTVQSEEGDMAAYASANGITPTVHPSGLYYQIITPGTGASPTSGSRITVNYVGNRLDGSIFDQSTAPVTFTLSAAIITGWQIGLPLLKEGGRMKMIVPSSLAYGCTGRAPIAPNTILVFDVELVDVL